MILKRRLLMTRTLILILCAFLITALPVYGQDDNGLEHQDELVDLDGDGVDELVEMYYDAYAGYFELYIDDIELKGFLEPDLMGFEIIDLDEKDDMVEIMIETYGPSDDAECLIFAYDGYDLIDVGDIYGWREITGDGSMYTENWHGFWSGYEKWVLNPNTHVLELVPQEFYYVESCLNYVDGSSTFYVNETFDIYTQPESNVVVETVVEGSWVTVVACKPIWIEGGEWSYMAWDWFMLFSDTGITGWATHWEFANVLEGLSFAD